MTASDSMLGGGGGGSRGRGGGDAMEIDEEDDDDPLSILTPPSPRRRDLGAVEDEGEGGGERGGEGRGRGAISGGDSLDSAVEEFSLFDENRVEPFSLGEFSFKLPDGRKRRTVGSSFDFVVNSFC